MTAKERATFAQIADLARSLQRMREPRERVAISRRLLALAVSLGDASRVNYCPYCGNKARTQGVVVADEEA